ncbi:winged helix-turn-helix domain-containing protein [Solirubrobacter ginsenosidimutans]|uniref:Winged helix-turn-helix domain-containing protein n=1 Tax=Solirubrobacter ginsenosidimutans TaxID=490573 RepID=A0A9X3N731_9ACTN|nr:BTAD domain-containing putative transcriptional regulator [Solirubrobacter ginsenosidimutans]MDA0166058.1 winged helix-turn-helix domain-containing protein [Solirubrobacter ginsenosidimutans]
MQIRLLGHLEANVDDRLLELGGSKQRAVLAMLGLEANQLVSADRLIEGLWGEEPPASAAKMVQTYVWRLRRVIAADAGAEIVTRGRAYELRIDRELIDALRFERLVGEATRGASGDAARQALALYRGEPLADIASEPFAAAEIRRLEELRVTAAELAVDADLAAGRHQEVLGEIDALLAESPLRERLHAQRMLALYRCGRQADALEAYLEARATLVDGIGVEPGPELQRLQSAILRQDPALAVEDAAPEFPPELEAAAAQPLIGRERELQALRRRWRKGGLVTLAGAYGMGKTRLAAELARELQREGATVFYASGLGPAEVALAAIARTAESRRPALLVLDDGDRAGAEVRLALFSLRDGAVCVLATGVQAAALARLEPREALVLEPLDAEVVAAIASFYAPPGGDVPVDELLRTSRGVARRVHEAASEWARHAATERVDALAGRAAIGRGEAWALESELAGSVADLQSTLERVEDRPAATPLVCPYKGLASFNREDAEYFFGREGLVAELVARLVGATLLAVVGASGSGKSSVVRAGLLPALAGGVLPGSQHWAQAVIRPGTHPARALRAVRDRGVLVVDQFEELFTACQDERERTEFVSALLRFPRVVVAVRADFYARCAAYPELSRALGANHVLVGPMTREELRRAIERPARRAGLAVDPDLADALLADVEGEPGALPLLSTALLELWGRRDGRRLRLAAYARSGGVQGAVARLAEDAYVRLGPAQQAEARRLFLRLSDEDESGAIVRRRIALDEQDAGVVARLTDRRLLTVSEGTVEVAHEALLHEWPRLRGWLDEDIEGRRLRHRLREAAGAWEADARDPAGLYRGARLAAALDWAAEHGDALDATERAFLEAARRASGRAQRRLRAGLAGVVSLLVLAVIAGILALDQRNQALARETAADAQRLGAQALASDDLDLALLLARQGVTLDDTVQTRGNLLAALLKSPAAIGVIRGVGQPESLVLSPDGRTLVTTANSRTFDFVDARTGRTTVPTGGWFDELWRGAPLVFDRAGSRIALGATYSNIVDLRSRRELARLPTVGWVYSVAFSADERELVALHETASGTTEVGRFDAGTGAQVGTGRTVLVGPVVETDQEAATVLATRDGRAVVTLVNGRVAIRDARTLAALRTFGDGLTGHIALTPDGRTLLLGRKDGRIQFVDLVSGAERRVPGRHQGAVLQLVITPDGRTAASAGRDNRILLWDVERRTIRETLVGHSERITGLAASPDGRTLYSSGLDGKIMLWDLSGERRLGRPFALPNEAAGPALSPDGRTVAVAHPDGTVTVVELATLRTRSLRVSDEALGGVAFLRDGRLLATIPRAAGSPSGYGVEVDLASGRIGPRHAELGSPLAPSVDAGGRRMAIVQRGAALVQPLAGGHPADRPHYYRRRGGTLSVALSADGRSLAVATREGIEIIDVDRMRIRSFLIGSATTEAPPQFSPDGRVLAAGSREGWVRFWSTQTLKPLSAKLAAHRGSVLSLSISRDGRTLASGGTDGTLRLFDLATRQPLGAPLPAVANGATAPVFALDGAYVFAITAAGSGVRWDLRPASWMQRACTVAGRTLTRAEWDDALPARDYAPACSR